MVYFALANKAKPPMTIAETHGRPTRGINTRRVSRPRPHSRKGGAGACGRPAES